MRLDLYQAETARIAVEQTELLNEARRKRLSGEMLSRLEQNGVLHALQLLVENAIGKAKQLLKAANEPVPVSAYEAFDCLARRGDIEATELAQWHAVIGLRNRIEHDYMNIDMKLIDNTVEQQRYLFVTAFLCRPIALPPV